jgi:very-short-patch-repair endonuclease
MTTQVGAPRRSRWAKLESAGTMGACTEQLPSELRMLARHQWVREAGTPRVSTLVGPIARSRALWDEWVVLRGLDDAILRAGPARLDPAWLDRVARASYDEAVRSPRRPLALAIQAETLAAWLSTAPDRLRAFIGEGIVEQEDIAAPASLRRPRGPRGRRERARSLAELTLYEALEATPATAGRFALNQRISARFGPADAEIDLLARNESIAVEVDGFHHFAGPESYRRDRRKDTLLQLHGYTVVRVLADDVLKDPRGAVRTILEVLASRRKRRTRDAR